MFGAGYQSGAAATSRFGLCPAFPGCYRLGRLPGAREQSGSSVREFLVESVLPLASVCAVVIGVTAVAFDVPREPPPVTSAAPKVELTPAPIPDTTSSPTPTTEPRRQLINDVLARAARNLAEVPGAPSSVAGPLGAPAPPADPKIFGVVSKLGEAMRVARDARDERDIAKAEELMRSVRQEMDAVCDKAGGSGPLCQSAEQIRSLGY